MGRPKKRQRSDAFNDNGAAHDQALQNGNATAQDPVNGFANTSFSVDDAFPSVDSGVLDSVLTPGGSLQPWMLPTNLDWVTPLQDGYAGHQSTNSLLTSTHGTFESPTPVNLPQELQNIPQTLDESTQRDQSHVNPASNAIYQQQSALQTCACLSTLYLTLSNLTTMDPSFTFPTSLQPLREAMLTASQVISCSICPTRFITGLQNVSLLNALLMCIAERFAQILKSVSTEASALETHNATAPASEQKSKSFRLADLSIPQHLHTGNGSGGLGCAAAFSITLSPAEWRSMAKKVVRAEVHGPTDVSDTIASSRPYFLGLITQMEQRQDRWHRTPPVQDQPRDKDGHPMSRSLGMGSSSSAGEGEIEGCENGRAQVHGQEEHLCLKMLAGTRRMVDGFDWD